MDAIISDEQREANLKLFKPFKGLSSLSNEIEGQSKNIKLDDSLNVKSENENANQTSLTKEKRKKAKKQNDNNMEVDKLQETSLTQEIKVKKPKKSKKVKESVEETKIENVISKQDEITVKKTVNVEKVEKPKIVKKHYILIENINSSITSNDLKKYLTENDIDFNKALVLPGSIGVANFKRQKEMERLFNICQGLRYKTNELFIFKSLSDTKTVEENRFTNLCETSVHVKNLDSTVSEENICALMPDLVVLSVSINADKGTAVIDFEDNLSARKCFELLDNQVVGERKVRASFLVKSQRPDVFTLVVSNLPKNVTKTDVKTAFPVASKIKLSQKHEDTCLLHFKSAEDYDSVLNSETEHVVADNKVTIEPMTIKRKKKQELVTQYVLNIYNLPFDTTVAEIKEHYQDVRYIEMIKNDEGKFIGSAKLMYNEKQYCEEALKASKGLAFNHRKVRAEMRVEEGMLPISEKFE